jgi:hypothetical protein
VIISLIIIISSQKPRPAIGPTNQPSLGIGKALACNRLSCHEKKKLELCRVQ